MEEAFVRLINFFQSPKLIESNEVDAISPS